GRYTAALDHFLAGAYWIDTAYVAERVLSTRELTAYVDRRFPATPKQEELPYEDPHQGGLRPLSKVRAAHDLRYLLARRLIREGRFGEARRYLPAVLRPYLATLVAGSAVRNGAGGSRAARAAALLAAACTERRQGMELLGTELTPDWAAYGGSSD